MAITMTPPKTSYHATTFPSLYSPIFRKKVGTINCNLSESNTKKATLSARKKERIKLPTNDEDLSSQKMYRFNEFLSHPSGIEAIFNTRALQTFQSLDSNTYRCTLQEIQFLNFEVAPVLDLQVTPSQEDCTLELLSCKFEGSEIIERQNNHFSASMSNHITWDTVDVDPFLEVDVKINVILEIYTRPFTFLPVSAVEVPGNLMMQALLDRLVPLHVQQLMQNYNEWVNQQYEHLR